MYIRFCEFCGTLSRDGSTHCPECGARMVQEATEERFSDLSQPMPFVSMNTICLRIQGRPRLIRFNGTLSVYHCWSLLHEKFETMRLYWRARKGEMDLVGFPEGQSQPDYRLLEPGDILNCKFRKFSFSTYEEADPDTALEPGELNKIHQCDFEIDGCPPKEWGNVLGWLVGTVPSPRPEAQWTYDI